MLPEHDRLAFLGPVKGYIPSLDEFLRHLYRGLPIYFRVNTLKASKDIIKEFLHEEGVEFQDTPISHVLRITHIPEDVSLLSYQLGLVYPQAISSCIPVIALSPEPGHMVLDLCAAPGGKTTYIAQLMNDQGLIMANDRKRGRIVSLLSNVKRMGITNTVVIQGRGEHLSLGQRFDRVLIDAPCSGQGKYRIDPVSGRIKYMVKGKTNLPAIQKALIKRGFDLLKPGGVLVYSTCTFDISENEDVVMHLLEQRDAKIEDFDPVFPFSPGIVEVQGRRYADSIGLCKRFYPHKVDSVGFFVARIVKVG